MESNTPFIRDRLKIIQTGFTTWMLFTSGLPVPTYFTPVTMIIQLPVTGFPLHYFFVAMLSPTSPLVLASIYSRERGQPDERYSIDHTASQTRSRSESEAAVVDGRRVE